MKVAHNPRTDTLTKTLETSASDVVKAIISEQEFMIEQLQNYITGER